MVSIHGKMGVATTRLLIGLKTQLKIGPLSSLDSKFLGLNPPVNHDKNCL